MHIVPPTKEVNYNRNSLITIACILSFMGGSLDILMALFKIIFGRVNASMKNAGTIQVESYSETIGDLPTKYQDLFIESVFRVFNTMTVSGLILFTLALLSIYGVYLMWEMKKKGFKIYSVAQILMLFLPLYSTGINFFGFLSIFVSGFFTVFFILIYASQLKKMS
jgi:hypothetical protein